MRDPIAPGVDAAAQAQPERAARASAGHRDQSLIGDIRDKVQAEFARHRSPLSEPDAERGAAALAVQGKTAGIGSGDHVVLSVDPTTKEVGKTVFLVKGELDSRSHTPVSASPQQAPATEESLRQLDAIGPADPARAAPQAAKTMQH